MKTPCSIVELVPVDYFNFQCIFAGRRVLFYALGRQSHLFRYSLTFNVTLNSEMFKAHPSRTK